jgi:hypothetical protein
MTCRQHFTPSCSRSCFRVTSGVLRTISASCDRCSAVARLIAHRISRGQRACSSETGAYCQARKRLPEQFFADVACRVGRVLDSQVARNWLWKSRQVYMFDGTTVSMPDTQENLKAYPKTYNQKAGQGFPLARVGALISLSCGAKAGKAPKPIYISDSSPRWRHSDLLAWLDQLQAESSANSQNS